MCVGVRHHAVCIVVDINVFVRFKLFANSITRARALETSNLMREMHIDTKWMCTGIFHMFNEDEEKNERLPRQANGMKNKTSNNEAQQQQKQYIQSEKLKINYE